MSTHEIRIEAEAGPGWTIARPGTQAAEHSRTGGGPGAFGWIELRAEPDPSTENLLVLNEAAIAPRERAGVCEGWLEAALEGLADAARSGARGRRPVRRLRVVITGVRFHPADSRPFCYREAARRALLRAFEEAGLVEAAPRRSS